MSHPNPDAEAALEQAAIALLLDLGWDDWADCYAETAAAYHITGRESRQEVVLKERLPAALQASRMEEMGGWRLGDW
jgi:hypothetical protein